MFSYFKSSRKNKQTFTIAFYNLENLFDTKNNPLTLDDDFTPKGKKNWNIYRYKNKIRKLGNVIAQLGTQRSFHAPAIIGIVEVENHLPSRRSGEDLTEVKRITEILFNKLLIN